jgi:hypothetical protein
MSAAASDETAGSLDSQGQTSTARQSESSYFNNTQQPASTAAKAATAKPDSKPDSSKADGRSLRLLLKLVVPAPPPEKRPFLVLLLLALPKREAR